nr:probable tyrosyl-DNA phosphodiesterase [Onthophagus taurus]
MHKNKKLRQEICPHAEKCYRRNPHHFKEYDHPHLNDFLQQGDDFKLPSDFSQSRQVVVEQLNVLKSLRGNINNGKSNIAIINDVSKQGSSTSVPNTTEGTKKSKKTTTFVAGNYLGHQKYTMAAKMENNKPYNLFFTTIPESYDTLDQKNSVTFADLLCPSLGELKCSLQLNFIIDISWLIEQYQVHNVNTKPLTIIYGDDFPGMSNYINKFLPNVKYHMMKMKDPFGIHHSKIGVYVYTDNSIRVVVSTANLYYEDWNHYNQGLWVSPICPQLPEGTPEHEGGGPTGFKTSLLTYLQTYNLPILKDFLEYISKADFSSVNVFFVASTPGKHYPKNSGCHLYRTLDLLSRHCKLDSDPNSWQVNIQASSIGTLGKAPGDWLRSVLLRSLACRQKYSPTANPTVDINIIYPTVENVMKSYFGPQGGGCLPYSKKVHEKQLWLQSYLRKWSADSLSRTRAMPHIKTYCRISPCKSKLAWFLLTSANISKAAWGGGIQRDGGIYVRSYEAGVMFFPSFFNQEHFEIGKDTFPFMYDTTLKNYGSDDYPWCN